MSSTKVRASVSLILPAVTLLLCCSNPSLISIWNSFEQDIVPSTNHALGYTRAGSPASLVIYTTLKTPQKRFPFKRGLREPLGLNISLKHYWIWGTVNFLKQHWAQPNDFPFPKQLVYLNIVGMCMRAPAWDFSHWYFCQLILVITLWMSSGHDPSRGKARCDLVVQQNDLSRAAGKVCIQCKCFMSSLTLQVS